MKGRPTRPRAWRARAARWGVALCGLAALAALAPSAGYAQTKEERAHSKYIQARNDFQAARFEEAAKALEEAYALFPQPLILVKLGEAFSMLGEWERALEAYRRVGSAGGAELQERVISAIRTLEAAVEKPVVVHLLASIAGVEADVAGRRVTLPTSLELPRGEYDLIARRDGFKAHERVLRVHGAGPIVSQIELEPILGELSVQIPSGTVAEYRLWVDDEPFVVEPEHREGQRTPPRPFASGRHTLVCSSADGKVVTVPFFVQPGKLTEVVCEGGFVAGAPASGRDHTWAWVAATGAAASITGGVLLLLDYKSDKDLDARQEGLRIKSSSKPVVGGVLAGLGGALAITSALLFADVFGSDAAGVGSVGFGALPEGGGVGVISGSF